MKQSATRTTLEIQVVVILLGQSDDELSILCSNCLRDMKLSDLSGILLDSYLWVVPLQIPSGPD